MKTKTAVVNANLDAGDPHVRFDERGVALKKPKRGPLLYKKILEKMILIPLMVFVAIGAMAGVSVVENDGLFFLNEKAVSEYEKNILAQERLDSLSRAAIDQEISFLNAEDRKCEIAHVSTENYVETYRRFCDILFAAQEKAQERENKEWKSTEKFILLFLAIMAFFYFCALKGAKAGTLIVFNGWIDYLLSLMWVGGIALFASNGGLTHGFSLLSLSGIGITVYSLSWIVFGAFCNASTLKDRLLVAGGRLAAVFLSIFALGKFFDQAKTITHPQEHTRKELLDAAIILSILAALYKIGIRPLISVRVRRAKTKWDYVSYVITAVAVAFALIQMI